MSTTLNIINSFSVEIDGISYTGKQGASSDSITDEYGITITGDAYILPFTLLPSIAKLAWDEDTDFPVDFAYMFIWADGDIYIQVIGSATNFVVKQLAKVPFTLSYGSILAAANTTPITSGVAPSVTDVDSVYVSNLSTTATVRGLAAFFN